jgi:hypothetical protein
MASTAGTLRVAIFTETFLPKIDGIVTILCLLLAAPAGTRAQCDFVWPARWAVRVSRRRGCRGRRPTVAPIPEAAHQHPGARRSGNSCVRFSPICSTSSTPPFWARLVWPMPGSWGGLRWPPFTPTRIPPRYAQHYGFKVAVPAIRSYLRLLHNQATVSLRPSTCSALYEAATAGISPDALVETGHRHGAALTPRHPSGWGARPATDGHPEDFLVVNVGRQAPEKQLELLRRPLLATPGVRLAPIGDGPSHPQLRQIFADTPLRCLR